MNILAHHTDPKFYGFIFLALALIIHYIINRRRFNRRGIGGLQQFKSFEEAVAVMLLERIFKWTANALILLGIFMFIKW